MSFSTWAQGLPDPVSSYVNDFAEALSPETTAELTTLLQQAKETDGREITVVTIKWRSLYGDYPNLAAFGTDLFNAWGIGNADTNDGVMLLFALEDRQVRIVLGDGFRARYDGLAQRIVDSVILPQFEVGEMQSGILDGTAAVIERLDLGRPPPPEPGWWVRLVGWAGENVVPLLFGVIASLAIVPKLLSGLLSSVQRAWPRTCPECSARMIRLGNVQEQQYLTEAQILEETLDAVHYDVWICPKDQHLTIKGRRTLASRYKACRDCGHHTCEVHQHTKSEPTRYTEGKADQALRCLHCGSTHFAVITLPMLHNDDNRFLSSGSRRSGGGSSGGFGGGSSSGGGASGGW